MPLVQVRRAQRATLVLNAKDTKRYLEQDVQATHQTKEASFFSTNWTGDLIQIKSGPTVIVKMETFLRTTAVWWVDKFFGDMPEVSFDNPPDDIILAKALERLSRFDADTFSTAFYTYMMEKDNVDLGWYAKDNPLPDWLMVGSICPGSYLVSCCLNCTMSDNMFVACCCLFVGLDAEGHIEDIQDSQDLHRRVQRCSGL